MIYQASVLFIMLYYAIHKTTTESLANFSELLQFARQAINYLFAFFAFLFFSSKDLCMKAEMIDMFNPTVIYLKIEFQISQ